MLDDANEFNEPLAFDIAIAKMDARTTPAMPYRHAVNDELRVNFVGITTWYCEREMLRINEEHHTQDKKQRELRENNNAACEQRGLAVTFVA